MTQQFQIELQRARGNSGVPCFGIRNRPQPSHAGVFRPSPHGPDPRPALPALPEVDPFQVDLVVVEHPEPEVGGQLDVLDLGIEPPAVLVGLQ